jgi:hypothetical protein
VQEFGFFKIKCILFLARIVALFLAEFKETFVQFASCAGSTLSARGKD